MGTAASVTIEHGDGRPDTRLAVHSDGYAEGAGAALVRLALDFPGGAIDPRDLEVAMYGPACPRFDPPVVEPLGVGQEFSASWSYLVTFDGTVFMANLKTGITRLTTD